MFGSKRWRQHVTCDCGSAFILWNDTACEKCGQWYNTCGQRLAPPEQWGAETGERFDRAGRIIL